MGEPMIRVENLTVRFDRLHALRGVNLSVEQGEVVGVIGPSGSGKSTLLRCLNLLARPSEGRVIFEGVDISDRHADIDRHRQRMGMVFQQFNLFNHLTVLENITLAPMLAKKEPREQAEAHARELLERVGLLERESAMPRQLSGGQKQRVAIARMLMQRAPIMVFDDSLSAVDAETDAKIRAALHESLGKATVLLISHRVTTLMQADCILVLDGGRVSELGTHAELIAKPGIYRDIYDIQMSSDDRRLLGKEGV